MSAASLLSEVVTESQHHSWLEEYRYKPTKHTYKALTRGVSKKLDGCELTFRQREEIDLTKARRQLRAYRDLLRRWGIDVVGMRGSSMYPDCCFVQDTAVVLDEICVVASMGAATRRGETSEIEKSLMQHRKVVRIALPATFDGGDVVQIGKRLFVGLSTRTNGRGIDAFAKLVEPFGYKVVPVVVNGGLHLTTGCGVANDETVILNPRWLDASAFKNLRQVHVPEDEPWAANTIRVEGAVCVEANAPRTFELIQPYASTIETLDISEFRKAEGSLSCLSLIFKEQLQS
jgi:dimethylargininase